MATETAVDVVMPQMGVSVSEGTITRWLKQEGEQVEADEPLLEISTDKVDTEVPSPASGTLTQILVQEGETVDVGTKLGQIGGSAPARLPRRGSRARGRARAAPAPPRPQPRPTPRLPRGDSRAAAPEPSAAPLRRRRRRPATGRRSCRRSSRGSRRSTASIRPRSPAPGRAAA